MPRISIVCTLLFAIFCAVRLTAQDEVSLSAAVSAYTPQTAQERYDLANSYVNCPPSGQDFKKAVSLYAKAAEGGHPQAQCALGLFYMKGRGVERDYARAVELFTQAAKKDLPEAQYNLAICYEKGLGVVADMAIAEDYLKRAAAGGSAKALEYLDELGLSQKRDNGDDIFFAVIVAALAAFVISRMIIARKSRL